MLLRNINWSFGYDKSPHEGIGDKNSEESRELRNASCLSGISMHTHPMFPLTTLDAYSD